MKWGRVMRGIVGGGDVIVVRKELYARSGGVLGSSSGESSWLTEDLIEERKVNDGNRAM